jgi:hypothetical protein
VAFRIHIPVSLVNEATTIYLNITAQGNEAKTPSTAACSPVIENENLEGTMEQDGESS